MMELLLSRREGNVVVLTLNRADKHNALSSGLAQALADAIQEIEADPAVRAVVLIGAGGRAFCAGADLAERAAADPDEKWRLSRRLFDINKAILASGKIYYAAIQGWCLGGGFELALSCDFRVADSSAVFGWPELKLGAYPGAGAAVLLPRLIGASRAKAMLLNTKTMGAEQAVNIGVADELVKEGQAIARCLEWASGLDRVAPLAQAAVKASIGATAGLDLHEAFEVDGGFRRPLEATDDYAEGIRAYMEKRGPVFQGR